MAKQGVTLIVQDGGLGQSTPGLGNVEVVIGVCSQTGGSTLQMYAPIQTANPAAITNACGYGPGPEMCANIIQSTGNAVVYIPIPIASPGVTSGPWASTSNVGSSVMSLQGTPQDTYYGAAVCTTACTIGSTAGQVTISLDYNRTVFATVNLPANYVAGTPLAITQNGITTGLTFSFGSGTLSVGDTFFFLCTEPTWSDAAVASAIQVLYNFNLSNPEDIMVVGGSAQRNGAGTVGVLAADAVSFDAQMTSLFNKQRYNRLLCSAGDVQWGGASTETEATWISSLANAFANVSSLRVGVTAGHYNCVSAISATQFRRPLLFFAAARDSAVAIQVDLGRVSDGALANLTLPTSPDTGFAGSAKPFVYHDETVNPGLDPARFLAAWSIARKPGLFIMNPNLMAPPGSDFNWLQHGHVIDGACMIAYDYFVNQLSNNVLVSPAGTPTAGQLLPTVSATLVAGANSALNTGLVTPGAVSAATCSIPPGQNILSSATLNVNINVTPLGYLKAIVVTIQFLNPATVQVSS